MTSQFHIQDGEVPKMVECDKYSEYIYILLSNGTIDIKASSNHQKHEIIDYSLEKHVKKMNAKFICTFPSINYGGFVVLDDGYLYNMPWCFLSKGEYKISRENRIKPVNEKNKQIRITTACYTKKGNKIVIGCKDGSLHVFNVKEYT